ncbi:hypothetical protein, unlikely [Trypanosoma brucei gambiense DAL972]|uniref:Uncharacterized protein n=1 Tax=Trypanosoma brucei gambiense (strain MHOM/CI/86/DAL972) TaxID=679716 RepID=D0A831_TRYB9|nr:hypothetical protein, unlikely [Trypanosoma brucei gambiense DAL972]CBH17832.1 hypothetical protein, unlikely [Trypanosoma brucei gambiense DAL972]|eukprot:XP_011780096.1 hypothetical protein, unlikely [Trypanosoma brucei gambiense DAL972]
MYKCINIYIYIYIYICINNIYLVSTPFLKGTMELSLIHYYLCRKTTIHARAYIYIFNLVCWITLPTQNLDKYPNCPMKMRKPSCFPSHIFQSYCLLSLF